MNKVIVERKRDRKYYQNIVDDFHKRTQTNCTWTGGNDPCANCPRRMSSLYMCKLLQDERDIGE